MAWCSDTDVEQKLQVMKSGKNHEAEDIIAKIEEAENKIRPILLVQYDSTIVDDWTNPDNTPPILKILTATLAAALILQDYYGHPLKDNGTPGGSLYGTYLDDIKMIQTGKIQLVDISDQEIATSKNEIYYNGSAMTPHYSMENPEDDNFGNGSLDNF